MQILFSFVLIMYVSLLCQILSATWKFPSLTWNLMVFLICPTYPPSGTQWCIWSHPTAERSQKKTVRAQRYDALKFPCQLIKNNNNKMLSSQ